MSWKCDKLGMEGGEASFQRAPFIVETSFSGKHLWSVIIPSVFIISVPSIKEKRSVNISPVQNYDS
jgi:hypothetical protein